MDNRQKMVATVIDGKHKQVTVDEGYCMYDPVTNRYSFKPDRGSNGYGLYSAEHRAKSQRFSDTEQVIKGKLVFVPENKMDEKPKKRLSGRCYGCCQENCGYTYCTCSCHEGTL
jgi:hypothetical protein